MIISGRRIRNLNRHLRHVNRGETIVIGLTGLERFSDLISQVGISLDMDDGETVLPPASLGPVSEYNAEGKYKIHRDQPMETAYRMSEWHWVEWHGPYEVDQSRFVEVPYQRYPRTFLSPPSIEFSLSSSADGSRIISTPSIEFNEENEDRLLHTINLFLEIFGECTVFTENLENIIPARIVRVNWEILPPGRRPWHQIEQEVEPIVREAPEGNQPVIKNRLQSVASYDPEFVAIGRGGFRGYLIFGFPQRNIYVLECTRFGNATYIFGERWETLSQLTKAEILTGNLQQARLIHREGWHQSLDDFMTT